MEKNKLIIKHCPNFYKIINFDYFENDKITERLISIYEKFIFSADIHNEVYMKKVSEVDKVLGKYVDDYAFRKEMKFELKRIRIKKDHPNRLEMLVSNILRIKDLYEEGFTRKIYISRWI